MKNGIPTAKTNYVRINELPEVDSEEEENPFLGPLRVFPGRFSVSRAFGDCEVKFKSLGGIPGCVTC